MIVEFSSAHLWAGERQGRVGAVIYVIGEFQIPLTPFAKGGNRHGWFFQSLDTSPNVREFKSLLRKRDLGRFDHHLP